MDAHSGSRESAAAASVSASESPSEVLRDLLAASSGSNGSSGAGEGEAADVELELEHWERFVEALDTRANATKRAVQNVLAGHHPEFADTFACSQDVAAQVGKLREDLRQAMDEAASEDSFQGAGVIFVEEKNRILGQLQRLNGLIETLEEMQAVQAALDAVDGAIDTGSLADAGSGLRSAEDRLDNMVRSGAAFVDTKVCRAVRVLARRKKAKLQAAAESLVRASLRIVDRTVSVSAVRGVFKIQDAFAALDALGTLRALARKEIGGPLLELVLRPLVADGLLESSVTQTDRVAELYFAKSSSLQAGDDNARSASPRNHDPELRLERVLEHVLECLRFVDTHVFAGNVEWMAMLADSVWGQADPDGPAGLAVLLRDVLVDALPEDPNRLTAYQGLALSAKELEDVLAEMGLVGNGQRPLLAYLNDLHGHLAQKRRAFYLNEARKLMVQDYGSAERALEEDPTSVLGDLLQEVGAAGDRGPGSFRIPDMKVTISAKAVLRLCYQCLDEAVRSDAGTRADSPDASADSLALVLVQTARDIIELFRVLVPARHKRALADANNSRLSLLLHNDCILFCSHLLVMGFSYRHKLGSRLEDAFFTVDLVPGLREVAAAQLEAQLQLQTSRLVTRCFASSPLDADENEPVASSTSSGADATSVDDIASRLQRCQRELGELAAEFDEVLEADLAAQNLAVVVTGAVDGLLAHVSDKLASARKTAAHASPDLDLTLSSNEISSLREALQAFSESISAMLTRRLSRSQDRKELDRVCRGIHVLSQVSACLERFLSIHIFQDKVKSGALDALSTRQIRGLTTFLFPSDV
ncbi:Centromere/kinetochore protein zw10-like [Hondaea fermentalgiana]|uniref:Centromere/kinetochore protein zw10-like n=1 Tax=Hondaea fermentalgiana TaxID=2315210 RepID=A0A2R5G6M3_9STRA|nr:Centromere/kinetochore protein zw10-like [Hondaea fermentalgiana]|eukprot:GBG26702.1 Centromere/kinetochore protein zw10-like [Hondaea fermentalgiana]